MSSFLEGLTFPQIQIYTAQVFVGLIGLVYMFGKIMSNKKISFSLPKGQLSYSKDTDKDASYVQNVSTGIFFLTLETVAMMTQIKTKLILHDQMTYLEERLIFIKNSILEAYRAKRSEIEKGAPLSSEAAKEYLFFKSLVELMKEDVKSNIRVLFLRNHFSQYDEKEMSVYMTEKNFWLVTKMVDFLRELYPQEKMAVPFNEVEEAIASIRSEIEEYLSVIFKRAARITVKRHEQINELEAGLREKVKESYGVDLDDKGLNVFSTILKGGEPSYER